MLGATDQSVAAQRGGIAALFPGPWVANPESFWPALSRAPSCRVSFHYMDAPASTSYLIHVGLSDDRWLCRFLPEPEGCPFGLTRSAGLHPCRPVSHDTTRRPRHYVVRHRTGTPGRLRTRRLITRCVVGYWTLPEFPPMAQELVLYCYCGHLPSATPAGLRSQVALPQSLVSLPNGHDIGSAKTSRCVLQDIGLPIIE